MNREGPHEGAHHRGPRIQLALAFTFSLLTTYLLLQPGASSPESTPLGDFRGFFSVDQLAYAGIASNAATGNLAAVEPFTETGRSFYPSLWYFILGAISGITGIGVPAAWTILGSLVVGLAVFVVGFTAYRLSGKVWAPALVGPALWIGPLALAFGDLWYLPLQSHALLWGPYGELFSLNAEAVGISLGAVALMLLLLAAGHGQGRAKRLILVAVAGVITGLLANVNTYSFLVTIGFVATWVAVTGISLAESKREVLIGGSVAIFIGIALAGSLTPALRESLAIFVLMLLAAVPGGLVLARRIPRLVITGLIAVTVAATPQALLVLQGLLSRDPFLTYRQAQSSDLGLDPASFLAGTLPIGLWAIALTLALRSTPIPTPLKAAVASGLLALTILSFNNTWGFAQEPYRMWVASLTLTALLSVPMTAYALANARVAWSQTGVRITTFSALAAVLLSWWNVGGFRAFVHEVEPIPFGSSRLHALSNLTEGRGGLFTSDPCIDPSHLKIASRERVAHYSEGLAWPADRSAIDSVIQSRREGILDSESLRQAGVTYLVTDSACWARWNPTATGAFAPVAEAAYGSPDDQTFLRLWLLQ